MPPPRFGAGPVPAGPGSDILQANGLAMHRLRLQEKVVIPTESLPSIVYAIADVHGRADLLEAMLGYIALMRIIIDLSLS